MLFSMESLYDSSKKLLHYLTHLYGYNNFLVDEVDDELVRGLRDAIVQEDRVKAVQIYLRLDKELDEIRNRHCYDDPNRPYKSNFRAIAKDMYRELKKQHMRNHQSVSEDLWRVAYILRFIASSDYYQIREMLMKKSYIFYHYWDFPLDKDDFYCDYVPLEAILDYCIKIGNLYITWR